MRESSSQLKDLGVAKSFVKGSSSERCVRLETLELSSILKI